MIRLNNLFNTKVIYASDWILPIPFMLPDNVIISDGTEEESAELDLLRHDQAVW